MKYHLTCIHSPLHNARPNDRSFPNRCIFLFGAARCTFQTISCERCGSKGYFSEHDIALANHFQVIIPFSLPMTTMSQRESNLAYRTFLQQNGCLCERCPSASSWILYLCAFLDQWTILSFDSTRVDFAILYQLHHFAGKDQEGYVAMDTIL